MQQRQYASRSPGVLGKRPESSGLLAAVAASMTYSRKTAYESRGPPLPAQPSSPPSAPPGGATLLHPPPIRISRG